jgi:magnesium-transporting ATPase (P-type)
VEAIRDFKEASSNFWILTGDKEETAVNIGYASGLIDKYT